MNLYDQIDHACNMHAELGRRSSHGRAPDIQSAQEVADRSRSELTSSVRKIVISLRILVVLCVMMIVLGMLSFANPAHAAVSPCSWDQPGSNPYTGTAETAILAMKGIPPAVKAKLIERAGRNDFDDQINIGRESITGKHRYDATIGQMAFGGRGRSCDNPSRAAWKPDHVEPALVFCESGFCVARPRICNNWSMVYRQASEARSETAPAAAIVSGGGGMVGVMPESAPPTVAAVPVAADSFEGVGSSGREQIASAAPSFGFIGGGGGFGGGGVVVVNNNTVTPAVPEPGTLIMIATGIGLIAFLRRRRKCM